MKTNRMRAEKLGEVLESYAKTDEERGIAKLLISSRDTTDQERVIEIAYAIVDGLKYGNWPWVNAARTKGA